jgi:hypothetical protein
MMSTTCGSDDGDGDGDRKRPWNPSLDSNQSKIKKAKKRLSSLAERALAALADDGGISGSDNEKGDVTSQNNSQCKKISRASLSDTSDGCSDKSMDNCGTDKQSTIQFPEVTDLTTGGEEDDDEVVVPHNPLSEYGDVLSCFLSTPFDRNEMLSLYLSKEGKRAGRKTNNGEGDHVPILPQKYFTTNNGMKVTHTGIMSRSEINHGSLVEQSNAINDQVRQFLLDECKKTIDETEQLVIDNHRGDDGRKPSQGVLPSQSEPHKPEILPQHYQHQHDRQQHTHQNQMDEAQNYQHQHDNHQHTYQQQIQYYSGTTAQYQSPYYPMQQMMPPLQMTTNWQYDSHPYAAAAAAAPTPHYNNNGIRMPQPYNSYNSLAFAAAQRQQQQYNGNSHQRGYQSVSHLEGINAPIPAITQREENGGYIDSHLLQKAQASTETVPQIIRRENDNDIESQPQDSVSHPNPKIALANKVIDLVTNSEQNSEIDEGVFVALKDARLVIKSSTPRTSTTLIKSSEAPPGLPCGWTSRTFVRNSGRTNGSTDTYFYSPDGKIKFRSMKKCYIFIEILKDPNIDGNESAALNEFKKRGHKL